MFEISYLIIFSLRETTVAHMSPQLAKLNRQFLIQLIVQAATPFCIIAVPFNIYGLAVAYQASFVGQGERVQLQDKEWRLFQDLVTLLQ